MKTKPGTDIPEDLARALKRSHSLLAAWEILRPSCRREYVEYVSEAVKSETRRRRIEIVLRRTAEYAARHPEKTGAARRPSAGLKTAPSRLKRPKNPMPGFIRAALKKNGLMDAYRCRPHYQQNDTIG